MTKAVMVDKDCAEMLAIETVFVNARLLICWFHVLQAVERRLKKAKGVLLYDQIRVIYGQFETVLYTTNPEEFALLKQELCSIGN